MFITSQNFGYTFDWYCACIMLKEESSESHTVLISSSYQWFSRSVHFIRVVCVCPLQLSSLGEVNVNVNMQKILSGHDGPKDLSSLFGKYLYIAVLVEESEGMHGSLCP